MRVGAPSLHRIAHGLPFLVLLIAALVPASPTHATDIVDVVRVEEELVRTSAGPDGYEQVSLEGFVTRTNLGEPMIPSQSRTYLLPEGMRVARVEVVESSRQPLPGEHPILPGGYFEAQMDGGTRSMNAELLDSPGEFPGPLVELVNQGWMRGHRVATVAIHPLQYRPRGHELVLYPEISYRLVLEPDGDGSPASRLRVSVNGWDTDRRFVASSVVNWAEGMTGAPEIVAGASSRGHAPTEIPSLDGSLVEYLIITTDEMVPAFERLAQWKTKCGVPAAVRTISWIEENYPGGVDLPEKIRNFLRDAYQKWGTIWVMIGGDDPVIPMRRATCDYYGSGDWQIPTDLYLECLDGNWNGDGDSDFGEGYRSVADRGDDADLYPELVVGRVPADTVDEVNLFIDNLFEYQFPDSVGFQTRALFIGEVVFPIWWNPGDPVYLNGKDCCQHGMQYLPAHWDTTTLFEHPDDTETRDTVIDAFNEGYALIAYVSHGDAFKMSTADDRFVYANDVEAMTNRGKRGVMFQLNCHLSQMELESINERFLLNPNGGLIAPLGCTHFDFPHVGQFYLGEFCRLMFRTDLERVGEINAAHKLPFMAESIPDISAFRWSTLAYTLMGDPEMLVWTELPESLVVTHAGSVNIDGGVYQVEVSDGSGPVEGAMVCFYKEEGDDYARGITDALGQVTFDLTPSSLGTASLVVIKRNFFPAVDSVEVVGSGASLFVESVTIDDDSSGQSSGNGDGVWDAGETLEVTVTLKNGGDQAAENVSADLGLPSGSMLTAFFSVDGAADPGYVRLGRDGVSPAAIPFTVDLSGEDLWGKPSFMACADTAVHVWEDVSGWHVRCSGGLRSHAFVGTLSTDGEILAAVPVLLEDDEFFFGSTVTFAFATDSTECEDGLDLVLADSFFVDILDTTGIYGSIDVGQSVARTFVVRADTNARDEDQARFSLDIGADTRDQWLDGFRLEVAAPALGDHYHSAEDVTHGNGDMIPDVGDTLLITCYIANDGGGAAMGVEGVLSAISDAVLLDSVIVFGDIGAGALVETEETFSVYCSGATPRVRLELTDSYGHIWREDWELIPPAVPAGVSCEVTGPGVIVLTWDGQDDEDLVGFNVYQMENGVWDFHRANGRVIDGSAYFEDSGLKDLTMYWYQVTAVDTSGNETAYTDYKNCWTNPESQPGWPQLTDDTIYSSIAVGDVDGNDDLEIVVGSKDWRVYMWDAQGNLKSGWPVVTGDEIWSSPALADIDGDPDLEIIVGSNDGTLYAWNPDGTGVLNGDGTLAVSDQMIRSTPAVADLDGDWTPEILVGCGGRLMVWNHDGSGYLQPDGVFWNMGGGEAGGSPAVADVDDDNHPEIFMGSNGGNLYAWKFDGTGYRDTTAVFAVTGPIWSSPSIGDLDDDGDLEIVCADLDGFVYVWDDTGGIMPGWPVETEFDIWSSPALGDLDGDGDLEIVLGASCGWLWAWHHDGTGVRHANGHLWYCGGTIWSSPALGDLDGDGDLEVLVGSTAGGLFSIKHTGSMMPGFPIATLADVYSSPVITDLDGDGDVEIAFAAYDGGVHVHDLDGPLNPEYLPWPMFCHDANRTGFFEFALTPVAGGEELPGTPLRTALHQNYPNPCNPRTTISYSLARSGPVVVMLYNVQGQRVKTLVDEKQEIGTYSVEWNGVDSKGHAVSSGVYFCRMTAGGDRFTRKVVMLK
ncbi:MAG: VCBS repeat-containing protein [Candidatus Eisenbacteria sp.]|nr:VCBS repeat-containing protein [Candidatus Eisenbacteria bacterium]